LQFRSTLARDAGCSFLASAPSEMMNPRSRSESPIMDDHRLYHSKGSDQQFPLFNANNARRKAEQDSILLANRIRLLRTEEEKARRKIKETESKTKEIVELRRRGEEKRQVKEADSIRKEALEHELRSRVSGVREEQQRKIQHAQREILEQKVAACGTQKQVRETHKQLIQYAQEEAAAEAKARAQQVRSELIASERRRARSEGARLEVGRANFQEKLAREEDARRANQSLIARMESEEAELIHRLQRSQERHRAAFAQLEDALAGGGQASASSSRCHSSLDHVPDNELPQGSTASSSSRIPLAPSSCANAVAEPRATASRPPRPRAAPVPTLDSTAGAVGVQTRSRPTSARRSNSLPRAPVSMPTKLHANSKCSKSVTALRDISATSSCSTASGGLGPDSVATASGHSTPSSAAPPPITYTTVDGMQLEIPPEEDLDLDKLLSG